MRKSFVYRLYPSKPQERLLGQTVETCRRFYNDCLSRRKEAWEQEQRSIGKFEQLRQVKEYKDSNSYAAAVHSHIMQVVVADLDKAFQAFFRRIKSGEEPGYPRFKGRTRFHSFGLKEYGNGFKLDGRRLKLSGIGRLAVRWHRPITGKIKTVRIIRKPDGWYAAFSCETEAAQLPKTGQEVGVDVGITSLIATSDGDTVPQQAWYRRQQRKLRVLQRRTSRRKKGGGNRRRAVVALQRHHQRIGNQRRDFLNKLSCGLVQRYDAIALEDLKIVNMVRNRHLSKGILDAGWGYLVQHLTFKAEEAGRVVELVDPAYTSQTCSSCRQRFPSRPDLSIRHVSCFCGMSLDRDINAAKNILRLGRSRWGTNSAVAGLPQEAAPL